MIFKKSIAAIAFVAASSFASTSHAATLGVFGDPWGQSARLHSAMNTAFGTGAWNLATNPADVSGIGSEKFVYLEGGDGGANDLETFLTTNTTLLMDWITGGGSLFINSAPNVGDGFSFGGMAVDYPGASSCRSDCDAVDPLNPIFSGAGTSFTGTAFAHGNVTGGTSLITDGGTGSVLSSLNIGSGFLMMGSLTTPNFQGGGDPDVLRANILAYGDSFGAVPSPVPLPAGAPLLLTGLIGLGAFARRRKSAAAA